MKCKNPKKCPVPPPKKLGLKTASLAAQRAKIIQRGKGFTVVLTGAVTPIDSPEILNRLPDGIFGP